MKKTTALTTFLAILLICFTSCSGYNQIMRNHLENADNYHTCEVILKDLYYIDSSTNEKKYDVTDQDFLDNDISLEVSFFNNIEELRPFLGGNPNEDIPLEAYKFQFHVTKSNSNILASNGFYTNITVGEKISVKVSDHIYMDSEYFYVAQLEYKGKEYLSFEEGLKNIVDMMNENKSLL